MEVEARVEGQIKSVTTREGKEQPIRTMTIEIYRSNGFSVDEMVGERMDIHLKPKQGRFE